MNSKSTASARIGLSSEGDSDLLTKEAMAEVTHICTEYEIELDLRAASRRLEHVANAYVQNQARARGVESHCFFAIILFPGETLRGFLPEFAADRRSAPGFSHDRRHSPFGRRLSDIFLATARRN